MPVCVTLVGYPGVGKSTYAQQYLKDGWAVITVDDAMKEVLESHGLSRQNDWSAYREEAALLVDSWLEDAVKHNKNIVFDALNTSISRRSRHMHFIKQLSPDYSFEAVVIHPPEEDMHADRLLGRAFPSRRGALSTGVLDDLYFSDLAQKFQMPTASEGYSKISEIGVPPHRPLIRTL